MPQQSIEVASSTEAGLSGLMRFASGAEKLILDEWALRLRPHDGGALHYELARYLGDDAVAVENFGWKLIEDEHDFLLARLGNEEAARRVIETVLDDLQYSDRPGYGTGTQRLRDALAAIDTNPEILELAHKTALRYPADPLAAEYLARFDDPVLRPKRVAALRELAEEQARELPDGNSRYIHREMGRLAETQVAIAELTGDGRDIDKASRSVDEFYKLAAVQANNEFVDSELYMQLELASHINRLVPSDQARDPLSGPLRFSELLSHRRSTPYVPRPLGKVFTDRPSLTAERTVPLLNAWFDARSGYLGIDADVATMVGELFDIHAVHHANPNTLLLRIIAERHPASRSEIIRRFWKAGDEYSAARLDPEGALHRLTSGSRRAKLDGTGAEFAALGILAESPELLTQIPEPVKWQQWLTNSNEVETVRALLDHIEARAPVTTEPLN